MGKRVRIPVLVPPLVGTFGRGCLTTLLKGGIEAMRIPSLRRREIFFLLILLVSLGISRCAGRLKGSRVQPITWEQAISQDSLEGYAKYIEAYPDSIHSKYLRQQIEYCMVRRVQKEIADNQSHVKIDEYELPVGGLSPGSRWRSAKDVCGSGEPSPFERILSRNHYDGSGQCGRDIFRLSRNIRIKNPFFHHQLC